MYRYHVIFLLVIALTHVSVSLGQGSKADYERSKNWAERMRDTVFRDRVTPNWIDGGPNFWYRVKTGKDEFQFVLVQPDQASPKEARKAAFDHAMVAEQLAKESGKSVNASNLPISDISLSGDTIAFKAFGSQWTVSDEGIERVSSGKDEKTDGSTAEVLTSIRPSGGSAEDTQIRFINQTDATVSISWINSSGRRTEYGKLDPGKERDQHTFVGHTWLITGKNEKPLAGFRATAGDCVAYITKDSTIRAPKNRRGNRQRRRDNNQDSTPGNWSAQIREHNVVLKNKETDEQIELTTAGTAEDQFTPPFHWSPDGKKLVVMQTLLGEKRTVYHVESSPDDQLQPKLHEMTYAKPGDKRDVKRPRLFDIESQREIKIENQELFENAWSLNRTRWSSDSTRFDFLYNARGHQTVRLIGINAETGTARSIIDEQSETFIDYAYKLHTHYTPSGDIIWMSERDGWNHLYRFDNAGQLKNQITQGDWVVRSIEKTDDQREQIWFRASGVFPGQDPYFIHFGRVDFDGKNLTWLTESNGNHSWEWDPTGEYLLDTWSRVDQAPVHELRRGSDGSLVCELEKADMRQLLKAGWMAPEPFVAKARDGKTDIHGVIVRPTNFDESKTYPIIEKIYAGPQGSFVPKSYGQTRGMAELAEVGFIVVQIDGMGTSNRSKAFHDVCWKNLADAGFPDRILWLQAAAKMYPQMDLERVGIYGGSAGGQNALGGLLNHGDFYKVGAADCGCHDNRMDKVWWNELWMGWPIGPHYEEQSNTTLAHKLQGKLLLTVGELDRNVDPASTMQVVNALIKADKDFDFIIVPGGGHGVGERPYAKRRRTDFFVRHLIGVEPRTDSTPKE